MLAGAGQAVFPITWERSRASDPGEKTTASSAIRPNKHKVLDRQKPIRDFLSGQPDYRHVAALHVVVSADTLGGRIALHLIGASA